MYKDKDINIIKKKYERQAKRLDRIIAQSDRQQFSLIKLNDKVIAQKEELKKLYDYDFEQQLIAKEKLNSTIVDDLQNSDTYKSDIIYHASDVLSGDFYSIYHFKNGAIFAYVIDGQGHGISPSLTVFAVSSTITNIIEDTFIFKDIVNQLFPRIQTFLGEIEQLTYTMIYIEEDKTNIQYISGGMYPFLIKNGENILKQKANNLPFMNFSQTPSIKSINIENWDSILIYTDGLVEDLSEDMKKYSPFNILKNNQQFQEIKDKIKDKKFEDDISVIKITKC